MKSLNGRELADFVKERQARQVRALRQAEHIVPKLAIVQASDSPVVDTYVRMKQQYGEDILVEVERFRPADEDVLSTIASLNKDTSIHGIIVQLPLNDVSQTQEAIDLVAPEKDVDGLGINAQLVPATAMAIDWLLTGYNVDLSGRIAIIGEGRLVGAPLAKLWRGAGKNVTTFNQKSDTMKAYLREMDVIVTAAGVPRLLKSEDVKTGAVVIDAATSAEHGKIVGDVSDELYERSDISITPKKGGVGPLTVAALFDNVIRAARATTTN
jgi:methylenetetrahydrofolate dehydrogenase (NADP+)/methenyltetrahydrofolate cyclohydrolase